MLSEVFSLSESVNFQDKLRLFKGKAAPVCHMIGSVAGQIFTWLVRLRKVFMAIPVIYIAIKEAIENMSRLPESVGINLLATGEFAQLVTRNYAVYGPLCVTLVCLLLMFCSRKPVFPWFVSILSLALPYLILLTNMYPA